ncbi:WcaI family glycosyltransferase [Croceicoccus sp. F390]|uniref:WcaI family glycosyltransferase n=1 Tax=Croceicoccus esteveae TaxID=3075597 RepID=A0ABU2ZGK9_9SPHN|nr:WcaI family glycosyltransferase [Croceicoccus sp. F390]MDT0575720.1 WcaI family glycosyltransferase [Croceicoccus sp. F390]
MKLLFIGLNYTPEPVGIGPYTAGLAEAMAARGAQVCVVAGKPYYPQWRAYRDQARGIHTALENGVRVTRVPHYIPRQPSGLRRLLHHASFAATAFIPAMLRARTRADADAYTRPGLVFVVAPSLLSVAVGWCAARIAGARLWVHVQDFEIEAAVATGLLRDGSIAARWLLAIAMTMERRLLQGADVVSAISPQMCARLKEKGVAPPRIRELRNWSNAAFGFERSDDTAYRQQWCIGARKVALYSGNIANKQGIEVVIAAAALLEKRADILFIICGEGPNREQLAASSAHLDNVQLHDLQPAQRMGDLLSLASVHLLPQIAGAADLVLPSKLTNMLRSGRPVVATALPGTGLFAEVEGCGIAVAPGDPQAFADAIIKLVDEPQLASACGEAALARAAERWDRDSIVADFDKAASALVQAGE